MFMRFHRLQGLEREPQFKGKGLGQGLEAFKLVKADEGKDRERWVKASKSDIIFPDILVFRSMQSAFEKNIQGHDTRSQMDEGGEGGWLSFSFPWALPSSKCTLKPP